MKQQMICAIAHKLLVATMRVFSRIHFRYSSRTGEWLTFSINGQSQYYRNGQEAADNSISSGFQDAKQYLNTSCS